MKRSDFFIKLTTAVLFVAVVSYVGIYLYNSAQNTFVTTSALSFVIEETFPAHGYIVRTETVMTEAGENIVPIVNEGERIGSGQAFAVEYSTVEALETASEIRSLRLRIAQIEAAESDSRTDAAGLSSVMELSKAVHSGNLGNLDELLLKVETSIFAENSPAVDELGALRARLSRLEGQSAGMRNAYAPFPGIFSQVVDGFEHIVPDELSEIRPSELTALFETPRKIAGACKLITSHKWYYAAIMDSAEASRLPIGRRSTLQFTGAYHAAVDMSVENVSRREDGMCVVLFSSDRGVHNATMFREMRADVLFDAVAGLRVPREAIHLDDDGRTFVFIQTGVRAERVNVEILLEFGEYYLVRDGAETGSPLRADTTIIVKANNLVDGGIVA